MLANDAWTVLRRRPPVSDPEGVPNDIFVGLVDKVNLLRCDFVRLDFW